MEKGKFTGTVRWSHTSEIADDRRGDKPVHSPKPVGKVLGGTSPTSQPRTDTTTETSTAARTQRNTSTTTSVRTLIAICLGPEAGSCGGLGIDF